MAKTFRKKSSKKVRISKKRTFKKKTSLKKMIKREISRNMENKHANIRNLGIAIPSVADALADNYIIPVCFSGSGSGVIGMVQGTGQGNRIGNEIKIKKVNFAGVIVPAPYNASTNPTPSPVEIKMYLFYDKQNPSGTPSPIISGNFFQDGSASRGFDNDLTDITANVNSDRWTVVKTKVFKVGYSEYPGTGSQPDYQVFCNNDFKLNCKFSVDCAKYLPKTVKWNDTSSAAITRGLWAMFVPIYAAGVTIPSTTVAAKLQYTIDVTYEDA